MPLSLYSKDSTDALLADKLDLAGGTMTGGLTLSATGIIFSDSTTMTTAPAGGALAADQLTDGVVAVNPTAGPTTAGDVLQYDGADLIWAAGGGSVAWGAITGTLSTQTDLQTELDDKLDLAGGTMTGGLTLSATGIIFSDATTLTTAPAGSTLAADQLTVGVVAVNPTAGPTTAGDVLQYDGTDLIWAAGGGGVAWGAITGTLSAQTDLNTALTTLQTNVDAKQNKSTLVTVSTSSDYYATSASENGVIYLDPSSSGIATVYLPDGYSGTEFANGCSVTVINRSGGMSPVNVLPYGGAFTHNIYGTSSIITGYSMTFYKIDGNDWFGQA